MHRTLRRAAVPTDYKHTSMWRCCLILISVLLLSSCSSTKMAYEFLDWVAMWKVDRMVDLTSDQRERAKAAVHRLHQWHRETQLPRYADYLEDLQTRLKVGSITGEQLHAETDKIQLMMDDILEKALPPATDIISELSDEQVEGLLENIAEERQEYVEEYIEPGVEERQEKNRNELTDHLKRFIGSLTKEQEDWIAEWSKDLRPYAKLSAKQQELWQEHLAKYLAVRSNEELLTKGLRELMLYRSDNWNAELQQVVDANQTLTYNLLARIFNSLTPRQQEHLDKRLKGYVADFRELARRA